ncbi:MAG: hypothetical protein ABI772_03195 [Bacteroidota bacterium]
MKTNNLKLSVLIIYLLTSITDVHAQTVYPVSSLSDLMNYVGYICYDPSAGLNSNTIIDPPVALSPGDKISITPGTTINLDDLAGLTLTCTNFRRLPLIVPAGVTLEGDYDLLGNPDGTLIYSNTYRSQYDGDNSPPTTDTRSLLYFFAMKPGKLDAQNIMRSTTISHVRIQGPSHSWTEFNIGYGSGKDELFCGGIQIWQPCKFFTDVNGLITNCSGTTPGQSYGTDYKIQNCEIAGFSFAGIFIEHSTDNITIENCYIHHSKGISIEGIGYGVWYKGKPFSYSIATTSWNLKLNNNIFDELKDAVDGTSAALNNPVTYPFNVNFQHNTLTQFAGGINRHNNSGSFFHAPSTTSQCNFWRRGYPVDSSLCIPSDNVSGFRIDDITQGNSWYNNNIFHKNSGVSSPFPADICTTYPPTACQSSLTSYYYSVSNNTFEQPHTVVDGTDCDQSAPVYGQNLHVGYATLADNYIESCTWNANVANNHLKYNNNYFNYSPGKNVGINSPQPPEVRLELFDANGTTPLTNTVTPSANATHTFMQTVKAGDSFILNAMHGSSGSQDAAFIIRYNTSTQGSSGNNNSGNNYYYHDQVITSPSTSDYISPAITYPEPGLYGIDVLAVANNNSTGSHNW